VESELPRGASADGRGEGLAGGRVSADRVGPDARKGPFAQCPPGDQEARIAIWAAWGAVAGGALQLIVQLPSDRSPVSFALSGIAAYQLIWPSFGRISAFCAGS